MVVRIYHEMWNYCPSSSCQHTVQFPLCYISTCTVLQLRHHLLSYCTYVSTCHTMFVLSCLCCACITCVPTDVFLHLSHTYVCTVCVHHPLCMIHPLYQFRFDVITANLLLIWSTPASGKSSLTGTYVRKTRDSLALPAPFAYICRHDIYVV